MRRRDFVHAASFFFATGASAEDRASRVESGLRPGIQITGRPEQRWHIADRMAHYKVPGLSISVISGGEVAWSRSYGVIEAGSSRKVNLNTLFQAASISKPVAALAVLRLAAKRKLSLDTDVNLLLRNWKIPTHAFTTPVTLRRLLTHTAGTTVHGFPGYKTGAPVPALAAILKGTGNTGPVVVDIEPGTRWRYSGGGYEIAQQVVEDITRRPFAAVVRQLVLEPLDLTHSTFEQPLPERLAGNAAYGHNRDGKSVEGRWHVYPEQAAAGLWTRPLDMANVLIAVQRAARGNTKFLPAALTREMLTRGLGNQGIGWGLGGSADNQWFAHGGANAGFRCYAMAYTSLGYGAVVMTNSDNGSALSNEILRSISAEYGWPDHRVQTKAIFPLTAEQLAAFTGTYEFQNMKATVTVRNGGLQFSTPMGVLEFLPESEAKFFTLSDGFPSAEFERDGQGRVVAVRAGHLAARRVP
jgi:CubicO group peptidase (beta-lactamase class C family)